MVVRNDSSVGYCAGTIKAYSLGAFGIGSGRILCYKMFFFISNFQPYSIVVNLLLRNSNSNKPTIVNPAENTIFSLCKT